MTEMLICSVPGCGRRFVSGRGGTGGKKPKCPMHYQRERRNSPHAEEPGPVHTRDGAARSASILVHITPGLRGWVDKRVRAIGTTLSRFVENLLENERARR